jgi:cell wall-associated NlpC family hydrolase
MQIEPTYISFDEVPLSALDYRDGEVSPEEEGDDSQWHTAEEGSRKALSAAPILRSAPKVVPFRRVLKRGSTGKDVVAVKRALSKAGSMKWGGFTKMAGPFFPRAVKNFQRKHGLRADGVYGPATHRKLAPYFDDYALKYLWKAMPPKMTREERVRQGIVADAYLHMRNRGSVHYTQGGGRMSGLNLPWPRIINWGDCSGILTCWYKRAGSWVNPNGYVGWPPYGYTGTLRQHGRVTHSPKPGDDVHYGFGTGRHVSVYVGNGMQIGHGSEAGPILGTVHYRPDFSHYRNHLS